jgi:hypothetical protein
MHKNTTAMVNLKVTKYSVAVQGGIFGQLLKAFSSF